MKKFLLFITLACAAVAQVKIDPADIDWPLGGTSSKYWSGDRTWVTLDKSAVGLPNVDDTSDANKPISTATQAALDLKQPLVSALTSWSSVVRASGFDAFVVTPSSANLRALVTDPTGTGSAVFASKPTLISPSVSITGTDRMLIEKSFPAGSDAEAAPALLIRDGASDPDASGALLNITSRSTAPANRSLFRVLRTGGVYIWDYIKVSPLNDQDLYAGSAMVAIASDLNASGTTLRVRNRWGHDLFAANNDAAFNFTEGPDSGGNVPRVFTIAGSANGLRPGMIVWGMSNDSGNAAIIGVRATPPRVEVRNGNDTALAALAASTISLGQTTPASGAAISVASGAGAIYNNATGKNAFVFASVGSTYGTVQNDGADTYSLGTTTSIGTLGTPMLQWSNTKVSITGALQLGNAYQAASFTATGYVTLRDSTGTTYKVGVSL